MKSVVANKEKSVNSIAKMLSNKELVQSYLKGKVSLQTLITKGIKLGKPL